MAATAWDAIIVGAGPAGSALACRLRPWRRVLLLERTALPAAGAVSFAQRLAAAEAAALPAAAAVPGAPAAAPVAHAVPGTAAAPRIGESLPGAARVLLQRCGAFERFLAAGHAERGATVAQWDGETPVWFDQLRDPNGAGWHLDRVRFDADLRASAAEAGAVLVDDCGPLRVRRDGGRWLVADEASGEIHQAPVLADATGRTAAIARQLGLKRRVEDALICLHVHLAALPGDEDHCTRVCADSNGWWYSVRVPGSRRVLAFHLDAADPELRRLKSLPALLAKARRHGLLAEVLPAAADASVHARPAGSAVLDDAGLAAAAGFFAIGDAGLSFDPIASQGLFHALASAESAANAIEHGAEGAIAARAAFLAEMDAVHAHYRRRFHDTYAAPLRFGQSPFWARRRRPPAAADHAG
ncbi:NAD(P)/FAD-dependent oxidoreductase [Tahibacter harae]|uniref:Flavin-dependent dehydrogenase n=1 Tax=Tahibacter harae TaxID=2963937 RepID=A0ABT1QY50_9GAMM|nr:hypothetical protein [Tahibacter harae]MCQ4167220.1 hypothetical protein [Tahibacter harae]